jgi:hypothetical protein
LIYILLRNFTCNAAKHVLNMLLSFFSNMCLYVCIYNHHKPFVMSINFVVGAKL